MPTPPASSIAPGAARRRGTAVVVASLALLAACGAWVLPALDADLPGGSIVWQCLAIAVAVAGAVRVRRVAAEGGVRLARVAAAAALVLALVWLGSLGLLWLVWPR